MMGLAVTAGARIPHTADVNCFVEDFSNGINDYTTFSGDRTKFSIVNGAPIGVNTLHAAASTSGVGPFVQIRRPITAIGGVKLKGYFRVTTLNPDDACIVYAMQSGTIAIAINPAREINFDAQQRVGFSIGTETIFAGVAHVTVGAWYYGEINVIPGAGKSTYKLTLLDGTPVASGNFVNNHAVPTIDTVAFDIDAGSSIITSATDWAAVEVCPA